MGRVISEDLRWRVVYLSCDNYNLQEISQLLRISIPTVHRILKCYRQWRCVINPFCQQVGRRKIFSGSDMKVGLLYYYNFITIINANIFYLWIYRKLLKNILIIIWMESLER